MSAQWAGIAGFFLGIIFTVGAAFWIASGGDLDNGGH